MISIYVFFMGSNCGYVFFYGFGYDWEITYVFVYGFGYDFLMALDTFFNGFEYVFTIFLWVWNGFGQNRTKIVILAKKRFWGPWWHLRFCYVFLCFFFTILVRFPTKIVKKL